MIWAQNAFLCSNDSGSPLIAEMDKLSGLVGLSRVDDRLLVSNDACQMAWTTSDPKTLSKGAAVTVNVCPSSYHRFSKGRFEQ